MPLHKLFRTTTFRLALTYLLLFVASVIALLGFIYWNTAGFMARQTDETLAAEVRGLAEQYRSRGLRELISVLRQRSAAPGDNVYLLARPDYTPIVGTLKAWPDTPTQQGAWMEFAFDRPIGGEQHRHEVRAQHFRLPGGYNLLVGRDVENRRSVERMISTVLGWTLALTIALGLAGATVFSRNALRRIETINRANREIMRGDLSRRLPVQGSGDEIDQLTVNLNEMLDQIERLMVGMKTVSDNIAHDLRSPLTRLRNRLEVTLMEPADEAAYVAALERTIDDADGLLKTFNALLSIARVEAEVSPEALARLDLASVLEDVADLYEPVAEARSIVMTTEIEGDLEMTGNRELLGQAIANLIDNAIKYAPVGGEVRVTAGRNRAVFIADGLSEPCIDVCVSDTGPGIAPEDRVRVLDRFVRLDGARNTAGSGLGLSLVAAVAKLHGAQLILDDAGPPRAETAASGGKGLLVLLRLPLRPHAD